MRVKRAGTCLAGCTRDRLIDEYLKGESLRIDVIVECAVKCGCADCEEALQRYAKFALHEEFTGED